MTRGELYLVRKPGGQDPKRQRVFVIVSRAVVINSNFSSVIGAPVYSVHDGLSTQVRIGVDQGVKKDCSIHCDELVSIPKRLLTHYIGRLGPSKIEELNHALLIALGLD